MANIAVIGTNYVGLVTAACFAELPLAAVFFADDPSFPLVSPAVLFIAMVEYPLTVLKPRRSGNPPILRGIIS